MKTCPQCGKQFGPGRWPNNFRTAKFCGARCAHARKKFTPEQVATAFWAKVDKTSSPKGCWLWTGALQRDGYAHFGQNAKTRSAHRYAYEQLVGPIPDGLDLLHSCDDRACVNPAHMWTGTHQENMLDAKAKGRHAHGERAKSKLTEAQVREIKRDYVAVHCHKTNSKELAERYGVSTAAISAIIRGDAWGHVQ